MNMNKWPKGIGLPMGARNALAAFLSKWERKQNLLGIFLSGSYATGLATPFSDIDLYIIMSDETAKRERGDQVIGGWTIEYNADPLRYIAALQAEQYRAGLRHCARKLATGKILLDRGGVLARLQKDARKQMRKALPRKNSVRVEMMKYYLWDQLDNLRDLEAQKSHGLAYAYHCGLQMLFGFYGEYLRAEVLRPTRVYQFMSDASFRRKYAIRSFPDAVFMEMARRCMEKRTCGGLQN